MGFWEQHAAAEQALLDEWVDVEPAECQVCNTVRRGVLLGVCTPCFTAWEARHG